MTAPNPERTTEVVEADLKKVKDDLAALIKDINDRWYQEEWDKNKVEELEKEEEKLKKELEDLKNWVSPNTTENGNDNAERWRMTKEEAMQYLQNVKGKSWSELTQDSRNWIMAVQTVLTDKWYNVWKIDWLFGKRTRAWVRKFQKDLWFTWKDLDGFPWPKTIKAILEGKVDNSQWGDNEEVKTVTYEDTWSTFTWTFKDNKPWNGTYKTKEGEEIEVKEGQFKN